MSKAPKVVEAAGTAAASYTSEEIEAVMSDAVAQAKADGVRDLGEIRERKLAALAAFKDERRAALSAEAEAKAAGTDDPKTVETLTAETRKRFEDQRLQVTKPKGKRSDG